MGLLWTNNASAKLAASVASGDTSFDVQAGQGAEFPTITGGNTVRGTLVGTAGIEIVSVTARSTDTFTVTRAQEGTTALDFAAGETFELRITAFALTNFLSQIGAVLGDLFYGSAADTVTKLAGNTTSTKKFLTQTGTGAVSAAPAWGSVTGADLSMSDVTTNNVSSTAHGFTPKSPADATQFLNGAATPAFAAVKDSDLSTSDITTNDCSTSKHGFLKKLPNDATKFMDGTGAWDTIKELDVGASTNDAGNTSTAITVDWSVARTQKVTATGNATVTHSNMVAGIVYTLEYYTGAGSFTTSFASTNFAGGTAPTLTTTASKVDVFTFYKTIGGTIFGAVFGQSFAP